MGNKTDITMRSHTIPIILFFFLSFTPLSLLSQERNVFGKLSYTDKNLKFYEKDSSATAIVLYERGDNYFEVIDRRIWLVKEYHSKIKILDEKGFDKGTIAIPLSKNRTSKEQIQKLRAVTHVNGNQYNVLPSEIFMKDINEYRSVKTFTFPKLEKNCVLEYSYKLLSPFIYNFKGWDFQSDIPKVYSEFNAKIPGNYVYNRALIGNLKLDINDAHVKKACFHIDGYARSADCEVLKYAMKDIPAFKAEKEFMLSEKNYISRLDFELSEYNRFDGTTDKYTKSWDDVDREFRSDKDIGRQLTKKNFFEKNVPEQLMTKDDALTRAKNIFNFVKEHYTWTKKYGIYGKARVKEAFKERKGNVSEINMSLINLLNAADIKTNLMLLSTREEGLPKQTHPVMSDFNYAIAMAKIEGKEYLLDATDKYMPFGMLPFRALNHYGRVMDFDKKSYWHNIVPENNNRFQIRGNIRFNVDEANGEGVLDFLTEGYNAVKTHKNLKEYDKEKYIEEMETSLEGDFKIVSHDYYEERSDDQKVSERFAFKIKDIIKDNMVYFNPFIIRFFNENPFLLDERDYPMDFGYNRQYRYQLVIAKPKGYLVHELPENQAVELGDKMVTLTFSSEENENQIGLLFDLSINRSYFNSEDYEALKNVFKHVTDIQKNTLIVFKKVEDQSR